MLAALRLVGCSMYMCVPTRRVAYRGRDILQLLLPIIQVSLTARSDRACGGCLVCKHMQAVERARGGGGSDTNHRAQRTDGHTFCPV